MIPYFYNGSALLQERIDNGTGTDTVLNFIYTADGKPYALEYSTNGGTSYTTYYYLTNLQGDVVSILDSNGAAVVSYSYDSWGKITATTGTHANTLGKDNPLRYRGYVYDEETSLYYLQSRYYDPQICRFINADSYASSGQGFVGTNMFAYCLNNPIIHTDDNGNDAIYVVVYSLKEGVPILGHAQLYFQDSEGNWHMTEYAGDSFSTTTIRVYDVDIETVENILSGNDHNKEAFYITGNFSACLEIANSLKDKDFGNGYNLFTNNCHHYVQNIICAGEFDDSEYEIFFRTNTHIIPAHVIADLRTVETSVNIRKWSESWSIWQ